MLGGLYNVDLLGEVHNFPGHILQVMGTIEVNTATNEVIDSQLTFDHDVLEGPDDFGAFDLPRLPKVGGDGIDFTESNGMLFINPQSTDGRLTWSARGSPIPLPAIGDFVLSAGPDNTFNPMASLSWKLCFFTCAEDLFTLGNDNPLKVGKAVPEPSITVLLLTAVLGVTVIRTSPKLG